MRISKLKIRNFRAIKYADLTFPEHVVLIGDNNTGKSTVLEAIDLVLGPERINRRAPIDEHDFYHGRYLPETPEQDSSVEVGSGKEEDSNAVSDDDEFEPETEVEVNLEENESSDHYKEPPEIIVEATITGLSSEQRAYFISHIEWWNKENSSFLTKPPIQGVDDEKIVEALRVTFVGKYLVEEDDFEGRTYYSHSFEDSDKPQPFTRRDKQFCGFLYLRSIRTGRRALSLEHGSLLDIILRLKEVRPKMWETTIESLAEFDVASNPELGISGVLKSINNSLNKYVPKEWGVEPRLRISTLTRDHLRKVITAFIATGEGDHSAPYYRQGTGTINMLVLAMLSQIAEDRDNVIFAMEEPETAIPPYAQKRIVNELRKLSSQSIITSHSPYVLEEFELNETLVLSRTVEGKLSQAPIKLPKSIKPKRYRQEFRTRFCEGLLSRRIMIVEEATELFALPAVARRLAELNPEKFSSLEALGICTIDAGGDNQIAVLGKLYGEIGKTVYGFCDRQKNANKELIESNVDKLFMHSEKGFENLVMKNTTQKALKKFAKSLDWPQDIKTQYPDLNNQFEEALTAYFRDKKGIGGVADFLSQCTEKQIPEWLRKCCIELRELVYSTADETLLPENNHQEKDCDVSLAKE